MPLLLSSLFLIATIVLGPTWQDPVSPTVRIPTSPNSTCPIMGKRVSLPLYADTAFGRIYVCCKPCIKKVLADVPAAYATAYPTISDAANVVCPVTGEPLGEHRTTVLLQGVRVALCCGGCVDAARREAQVVLALAREPKLIDVGNATCPVDGQPVQANVFVIVDDALVRLSSAAHAAAVAKEPQAKLEAARAIRARQSPPSPHRHVPGTANGAEGR